MEKSRVKNVKKAKGMDCGSPYLAPWPSWDGFQLTLVAVVI